MRARALVRVWGVSGLVQFFPSLPDRADTNKGNGGLTAYSFSGWCIAQKMSRAKTTMTEVDGGGRRKQFHHHLRLTPSVPNAQKCVRACSRLYLP